MGRSVSPAANTLGDGDQPVPAPARRQPGALAAVDARGAGRGGVAGRADPAVDRIRGLPLVPRDGPRVVRGRPGRRGDERRVRLHQGRPRGAARPRRGLHERHRRADRSGRLADDLLPHPRRPAVLLRHLLPEAELPATARRGLRDVARPAAARWRRPPTGSPASCGRWRPACPAAGRRCSPRCATTPSPRVLRDEDVERGGFGGAPKFPPSALLEALLRSHERTGDIAAAGGGRAHLHGDGPRRHLRPARRRVRPLQRRRVLGGAALREDALRQRPAAAGVRALGASHVETRWRARSPTRPRGS